MTAQEDVEDVEGMDDVEEEQAPGRGAVPGSGPGTCGPEDVRSR
ncbi:hypothetical protein [Streptomyces sp. UH6]|nr:hypothetical protein [Streptomyces sp. UH6]